MPARGSRRRGPGRVRDPPDARLALPALATWGTTAAAVGLPVLAIVAAGLTLLVAGVVAAWIRRPGIALTVLAAGAAAVVAALHVAAVEEGPVPALATHGAVVSATLTITGDPVLRHGQFSDYVLTKARVDQVTGRGISSTTSAPVLVLADRSWLTAPLGSRLEAVGRLQPADGGDLAAVFLPARIVHGPSRPAWWWRSSAVLRKAIVEGVSSSGPIERALIPALVDGDDHALPDDVKQDFRTSGLTHLLAVSGTNLTLVVGFLLTVSRRLGLRGYAQIGVGILGTAAFVVLARPEPSVLRAAAMGLVALAGLGAGGRRRGIRALSLSVLVLLLLDPWLARSVGFLLSALATAGILVLGPPWRTALARWMPPLLAEAIAVPMAAQIVCTPVIAAISGQVSLVAVVANLLAGPAVGPATVLGLLAGGTTLVWRPLGHLVGWVAGAAGWWIIEVAHRSASLPGAALTWSTGLFSLGVLLLLCAGVAAGAGSVLRRPLACGVATLVVVPWMLHPLHPGWPPSGWVMVACDVGQGDGLVLNAGGGAAVVVDTGPDPSLMDACLNRLGISDIPLVVLTHEHADHVDGLPGVLAGRHVGEIEINDLDDPPEQYAHVLAWASAAHVPIRRATFGERRVVGPLAWQVLGPVPGPDGSVSVNEEGSPPNNASTVMLVTTKGIRLLLCGDAEPPAQQAMMVWGQRLRVDVLKVPHHGSRYQDPAFIAATGARLALISVGAGNDYGHPAPSTISLLRGLGMVVRRTDEDGDVAVVVHDRALHVVTR
ncbi:MAG: ComEC/Rec2 family competence protein [Nocardioidaceae bacterium]